jgi:type IV fimbrial biogenesis protein FimT
MANISAMNIPKFLSEPDQRHACMSKPLRGFTLVEAMVVLAVVSSLIYIAAPSMNAALNSVRLSSASNLMLTGIHLARSEAIKRNARVVLCKSGDGTSCSASGGWEQGWIIFHDANNNGLRESDESIIQREMPLSTSLRLTGNQNVARYVSFSPTGSTKMVGGSFQAGTLTVCTTSATRSDARLIVLNAVGRPRVQKGTVTSCA